MSSLQLTEEQKKMLEEFMATTSKSSEAFSEYFMRDEEEAGFFVPTRNHRVIGEVPKFVSSIFSDLDNLNNVPRYALASPRGFMKSTICSVLFPIKATMFGDYREILLVSNSESLAVNFLRSIKTNLESNERLTRFFGSYVSDKWTENHIIAHSKARKIKTSIRAVGWGAQIRGFRPDLIIMDDIESDETVISEEVRKKMREWVLKAAINSLTVDGKMVWVGTVINRVALLNEWINNPPVGWKRVFNQAYKDGIQEPGRELWPEVWPHERLQQRKSEIGSFAFSSEFMNEPIPSGGNSFNIQEHHYYEDRDLNGKNLGVYIAIDPAFSEDPSADFGVIMVALHDEQDNIYVHSYYRQRTNSRKMIDEFERIFRIMESHPGKVRAVGIEEVGPQKSFYQQLVAEINQKGLYPPFVKLKGMIQTQSGIKHKKEQRIIYSLQPRFEAKKIFLRRDQYELIDELLTFSEGGNKHDDMVDALSYITSLLTPFQSYSQHETIDLTPDVTIDHGTTGYGEQVGNDYMTSEYIHG